VEGRRVNLMCQADKGYSDYRPTHIQQGRHIRRKLASNSARQLIAGGLDFLAGSDDKNFQLFTG